MQDMTDRAIRCLVSMEGLSEEEAGRIHRNLEHGSDDHITLAIRLVDAISLSARGMTI